MKITHHSPPPVENQYIDTIEAIIKSDGYWLKIECDSPEEKHRLRQMLYQYFRAENDKIQTRAVSQHPNCLWVRKAKRNGDEK